TQRLVRCPPRLAPRLRFRQLAKPRAVRFGDRDHSASLAELHDGETLAIRGNRYAEGGGIQDALARAIVTTDHSRRALLLQIVEYASVGRAARIGIPRPLGQDGDQPTVFIHTFDPACLLSRHDEISTAT